MTFVCRAVNARFIPSTFFVYKAEILCLRLAFSEKAALPLSLSLPPPLPLPCQAGRGRARRSSRPPAAKTTSEKAGNERGVKSASRGAQANNEQRPGPLFFWPKKNVRGMGEKSAKLVGRVSRRYWSVGLTGRLTDMRFRGLGTRAVVCRACFSE